MATFLELKNRVIANVIDLPPTVSAAIPRLVNSAIKSAQKNYNFIAMRNSETFTTTDASHDLGSITLFKEYRDDGPYVQRQLSTAYPLRTALAVDAAKAVRDDADVPDQPRFVLESMNASTGATTFTVFPYADDLSDWDDGNYRIVIPYYAYTAELSVDGDSNWFTVFMDDYVEYQATAEGFMRDWDYDSAAIWFQRAKEKFNEAVKEDKRKRVSSVETFVPHYRGNLEPRVRN